MGAASGVLAVLSDLLESFMKRCANIKVRIFINFNFIMAFNRIQELYSQDMEDFLID